MFISKLFSCLVISILTFTANAQEPIKMSRAMTCTALYKHMRILQSEKFTFPSTEIKKDTSAKQLVVLKDGRDLEVEIVPQSEDINIVKVKLESSDFGKSFDYFGTSVSKVKDTHYTGYVAFGSPHLQFMCFSE